MAQGKQALAFSGALSHTCVCMPVALYLRVSTEEQRERQSIATQREFAERFCTLHHLQVSAVYADDGVSGIVPLPVRPAGARILPDARLHRFDQLLVYRLDRLGRDTRLTLQAVAELEQCGVRVKSLTEDFDTATASGRLMLTLLSGFAAHEREVIRERSIAGSQRVAENGGWMGGMVPFGYRKQNDQRRATLVVSEEPVDDLDLSEAEVIRRIFRMAAEEQQSCRRIADYLNSLGVPCATALAGRRRKGENTAGRWRAGRVRNLLISTIYKGQHFYGKRSRNRQRPLVPRAVPAIVSEAVWRQAQESLHHNFRFGPRHCRYAYLLRGLVKCGLCGLTYIGMTVRSRSGRQQSYYRCNGKHDTRGVYGEMGKRCPSKDVQAGWLEQAIWEEVEGMLRQPARALEQLRRRLAAERQKTAGGRARLASLQQAVEKKGAERDRVLGLYRKGRIGEAAVERQMQEIAAEEEALRAEMAELAQRLEGVDTEAAQLDTAAGVLEKLGARLQEPISWELRRELIESLVEKVRVDTRQKEGNREASITVTYRLSSHSTIRPQVGGRHVASIADRAATFERRIQNRTKCPSGARSWGVPGGNSIAQGVVASSP